MFCSREECTYYLILQQNEKSTQIAVFVAIIVANLVSVVVFLGPINMVSIGNVGLKSV